MKCVCISCFNYYDTRMESVIKYFKSKGYKVTYIISDFNHFGKKRIERKYRGSIKIHVPGYKNNLSVHRLMSHFIFAKNVGKIINKIEPDIIYSMLPPNLLTKECALYKMNHKVKLIFDCYDTWPESFPDKWYKKYLKFPFARWAKYRDDYIETADLLLCVSKEEKQFFLEKCENLSIEVLKPVLKPLELPNYKFDVDDMLTFCYLGNINYITDIKLALEILGKIAKVRGVCLHIIGQGQNLGKLVSMLENVGVIVVCHGVIFDDEEKIKIISECDFGLNIPNESIKSTMSLKSVEYMRLSLPMINSGRGENHEMVIKAKVGFNVDRNDVDQLVQDILNVDTPLLNEMSKNCKYWYEEHFLNQDLDEILGAVVNGSE